MGMAGELCQYSVWSGKRTFGIYGPVDLAQGFEPIGKRFRLSEHLMFTEALQLTGTVPAMEIDWVSTSSGIRVMRLSVVRVWGWHHIGVWKI